MEPSAKLAAISDAIAATGDRESAAIQRLYELKIITIEESVGALEMIRPYVSKHNYDKAKNYLEV